MQFDWAINRLSGYIKKKFRRGGSKRGNSKLKRVVCKELTTNWRKYFKLSAKSNAVNIKVCLNAGRGRQIKVGNSNKQSKLGGRTFVFTHTCIFATYTLQYTYWMSGIFRKSVPNHQRFNVADTRHPCPNLNSCSPVAINNAALYGKILIRNVKNFKYVLLQRTCKATERRHIVVK